MLIAGDFAPINRAEVSLVGNKDIFDNSLHDLIQSSDFFIANLECPITNASSAIKKTGPHLRSSPKICKGLQDLGFSVLSLANNHIMDYGVNGLTDTVNLLQSVGIPYFGCQLEGKGKPFYIVEEANVKVGVLSYSNFEFSTNADFGDSGAWPINLIDILEVMEQLQDNVDHIVVLLHEGLYSFPLPYIEQQKLSRFLIKRGAKAVLCQHSHICGSFENFQGGFISYGQGSFVFDLNNPDECWNEGYIVQLNFDKDNLKLVQLFGTKQFGLSPFVRLMNADEQKKLFDRLEQYNNCLNNIKNYNEKWYQYIEKQKGQYYGNFILPQGKWMRRLTRRMNIGNFIPKTMKQTWLNLLRNEEHRQLIIALLKRDLDESN